MVNNRIQNCKQDAKATGMKFIHHTEKKVGCFLSHPLFAKYNLIPFNSLMTLVKAVVNHSFK